MNKKISSLVGSGDRIGLFVLPFFVIGACLNIFYPFFFSVGGLSNELRAIAVGVLMVGVTVWLWTVTLILTKVPKNVLITNGPYSLVKHPLYTGVSLLVLPWLGLLLNTSLGIVLGVVLYFGSRLYSPKEDEQLANTHGEEWKHYCRNVNAPWL